MFNTKNLIKDASETICSVCVIVSIIRKSKPETNSTNEQTINELSKVDSTIKNKSI